jgi:hypothetical protein
LESGPSQHSDEIINSILEQAKKGGENGLAANESAAPRFTGQGL